MINLFIWVSCEKTSSPYCVILYFWRACRGNLWLTTLGGESSWLLSVSDFAVSWSLIQDESPAFDRMSIYREMNLYLHYSVHTNTVSCHRRKRPLETEIMVYILLELVLLTVMHVNWSRITFDPPLQPAWMPLRSLSPPREPPRAGYLWSGVTKVIIRSAFSFRKITFHVSFSDFRDFFCHSTATKRIEEGCISLWYSESNMMKVGFCSRLEHFFSE